MNYNIFNKNASDDVYGIKVSSLHKSSSLNALYDNNSFHSPNSNNSFHSPNSNSSFHSPNSNSSFHSPNSNSSFHSPNSNSSFNSVVNSKSILKNNVGSTTIKSIGSKILPPLPLQEFQIDKNIHAKTINEIKLKHINHNINENDKDDDFYDESECTVEGNLQDPFVSKKLSKYFLNFDKMESELKKYVVYISPSFGLNNNSDNHEKIKIVDKQSSSNLPCLIFDSKFECGNIDVVQLVEGRDYNQMEKGLKERDIQIPIEVQQEYDLTIRNDINTTGNIQWYYFSINTGNYGHNSDVCTTDSKKWLYPYKVRFNIINFTKSDSLYNYGMRPVVFSTRNHEKLGQSWGHNDTSDICYYQNRLIQNIGKGSKKQYTLTFTYTINGPDLIYFAHSYPYTYSDHLKYMALLEEDKIISKFMRRSLLCNTLLGNRCDLLTITNRGSVEEIKERSAIVISARVHPGESNSSFIMHGLIKFLTSQDSAAVSLRNNFVFKIVPMLNPDGVIHGNYRCSMMGTDLNRRYKDVHPLFYPTVSSLKSILKSTHEDRCVLLFLDIHGHSKKKNAFIYGCDVTLQSGNISRTSAVSLSNEEKMMQKIYTRIFPTILSSISNKDGGGGYFSSIDNSYKVQKSKKGTARVVAWRDIGIEGAYTIEASFCSNGNNSERKDIKHAFKNEMFRTDDDDAHSVNITDDKTLFVRADAESIRLGYQHTRHYTRNDYLNMGRDICLSIFRFANLETGDDDSQSKNNPSDMDALDEVSTNTDQDFNIGYLQRISYNNYEKSTRPMLRAAIFSSDAIMSLMRNSTIFQRCMRLQTEVYLRNVIGNPDKNVVITNPTLANLVDSKFGKLCLEIENDEENGSDSDPSVDNMDQKDLISSKNMKKMKSMGNILKAFIKSTINRLGQNCERNDTKITDINVASSQIDSSKSNKSSKIAVRQLNKRPVPRRSYQFKSINPSQETEECLKSESNDLNVVLGSLTKEANSPSPVFDYEELHWSEKHYSAYKAQLKAEQGKSEQAQQKLVEKTLDYSFPVSSASFGNMRDSLLFPQKSTSGVSLQSASATHNIHNFNNNYSSHINSYISQNDGYNISNDYCPPFKTIAPYKNSHNQKPSPSIELFTKEKLSSSPINITKKSNSPVIEKTKSLSNLPVNVFDTSNSSISNSNSYNSLKKDTTQSLTDFFRTMSTSSLPLPSSSTGPMEDKEIIATNKMYDINAPVPVPTGYQRKIKMSTNRRNDNSNL